MAKVKTQMTRYDRYDEAMRNLGLVIDSDLHKFDGHPNADDIEAAMIHARKTRAALLEGDMGWFEVKPGDARYESDGD